MRQSFGGSTASGLLENSNFENLMTTLKLISKTLEVPYKGQKSKFWPKSLNIKQKFVVKNQKIAKFIAKNLSKNCKMAKNKECSRF